jgi:nitrile hydratase
VWDSSSEVRYLVLPQPPYDIAEHTAGELTALVTRDHMIGVAR